MSKRSSTQESVALVLELLKRIPRNHKVTAAELHQQLMHIGIKRDLRSIQRNLEMLCEHFDIIKDDRCKPYGYSWNKTSTGLFLPNLTVQESLLLSLAEQYLQNLLPNNLVQSMEGFFKDAKYRLQSSEKKEVEWLKKVRVVSEAMPLLPPKIDTDIFKNISEALYYNRLITIEYYNNRQEQKSGLVMPLGLAQQGYRLYLVCRFDGYDNERSIAIHRVSKVTISTFTFERPQDFELSQYDSDGRFSFGEGEKCKLSFKIDKCAGLHLLETPLSSDQRISELDSYYHIKATVIKSKNLDRWLASFGEQVWGVYIEASHHNLH